MFSCYKGTIKCFPSMPAFPSPIPFPYLRARAAGKSIHYTDFIYIPEARY